MAIFLGQHIPIYIHECLEQEWWIIYVFALQHFAMIPTL